MKKGLNIILILSVIILMVIPLLLTQKTIIKEQDTEIFAGADTQAVEAIKNIQPDYEPWFKPLFEPPSGEIESLLFALQAAIGSGFIGYYFGVVVTRERLKSKVHAN